VDLNKGLGSGQQIFCTPDSGSKAFLPPAKIEEDGCVSSPPQSPDACASSLSPSPQKASAGKENRAARVAQTPNRLPTVQENDGLLAVVEDDQFQAWVINTPKPAGLSSDDLQDMTETMHKMGMISSPTPPGLENVSRLPLPPVKNTFLQFESPKNTSGQRATPKSAPPGLAQLVAEAPLAIGETPNRWDDQIPIFPGIPDVPCLSLAGTFEAAATLGVGEAMQQQAKPQRGIAISISDSLDGNVQAPSVQHHRGTEIRISDFMPPDASQAMASAHFAPAPYGFNEPRYMDGRDPNLMQHQYMHYDLPMPQVPFQPHMQPQLPPPPHAHMTIPVDQPMLPPMAPRVEQLNQHPPMQHALMQPPPMQHLVQPMEEQPHMWQPPCSPPKHSAS